MYYIQVRSHGSNPTLHRRDANVRPALRPPLLVVTTAGAHSLRAPFSPKPGPDVRPASTSPSVLPSVGAAPTLTAISAISSCVGAGSGLAASCTASWPGLRRQ
jgi:hypothetical protein